MNIERVVKFEFWVILDGNWVATGVVEFIVFCVVWIGVVSFRFVVASVSDWVVVVVVLVLVLVIVVVVVLVLVIVVGVYVVVLIVVDVYVAVWVVEVVGSKVVTNEVVAVYLN